MLYEANNTFQYYWVEMIKNKALRRKKIMKDYENGLRLPKPIILLDTLHTSVGTVPSFASRQNFTWAGTLGQHCRKCHGSISKWQFSSR